MSHLELVTLIVPEYDSAIAFFVEMLGFELVEDSASLTNDGRPKRWVVVRPPNAQTGILLARADGEVQRQAIGNQMAGRVGLFLRVDDFERQLARMRAAGVTFVVEPRDEPYGRVAVFLDLCGNRWDLLGPRPGAHRGSLDERLRSPGDPAARALALFHRCARDVPAYRAFLAEHGVDPAAVASADDFARLPLVTKEGYVNRHPLPARCRGGTLASCDTVAVSSGSTGDPAFWPRAASDEIAVATRFEQVFIDSFRADERSTLAVVCFPLGTWVGGMFTAACCRHLAARGYRILTVTPGNVKPDILRVVERLGLEFEQTVLLGYPPFLKDVIDTGRASGVPWSRFAMKLVCAGEVFS